MTNDYGNLELHTVLLDAMKDIDRICRENGLKYYLYAGTLLGAINHKGFIPWDDDIDLAMFPSDFKRFAAIVSERYSDRYEICTFENNPNWYSSGNKLLIKGTRMIHYHDTKTAPFFIDICMLHNIPEKKFQRFIQRKQLELINLVWNVKSGIIIPSSVISKMSIGLLANIRGEFWGKCFKRVSERYDNKDTKYVATMFGVLVPNPYNGKNGYEKDITPRIWHEHPLDIPFEDSLFMTLSEPYSDLDNRYPNWRKPMPTEKRITKHDVKTYEISPEVRARVGL